MLFFGLKKMLTGKATYKWYKYYRRAMHFIQPRPLQSYYFKTACNVRSVESVKVLFSISIKGFLVQNKFIWPGNNCLFMQNHSP